MSTGMDFFDYQDKARRNTGRLIILFGLAVAGIILVTYLVIAFFCVAVSKDRMRHYANRDVSNNRQYYRTNRHYQTVRQDRPEDAFTISLASLWQPPLLLGVGTGVLAIVGIGTAVKLAQLRSGGRAVAESFGCHAVDASLAGPQERKIINVVEEMAIASGIPVPPVYILEESGINAFAAGYTPKDAVVTVTRGSVERLTRDELQGVVGHEFSHILNGDMRLNIQLIGVLNGILTIGIIGWYIMRVAIDSGGRRVRRSSKEGGGRLAIIALGAALMVIGYVGTFFGNLIKAAVSRQREFLADASSVQFTRNPLGIAGALRKIGGLARGSKIENDAATQVSHMFFGQACVSWLDFIMATHPPLAERVRRIDPAWDGQFTEAGPLEWERVVRKPLPKPYPKPVFSGFAAEAAGVEAVASTATAARVGRVSEAQLANAASLIAQLPESVKAAAREPFTARALVYAMLINAEAKPQALQLTHLRERTEPGTAAETERLLNEVRAMDERCRLPALDLAMPALRRLSQPQYITFRDSVVSLVGADEKEELFEWMLRQVVLHNLESQFGRANPPGVRYYGLGRLTQECSLLLSTLSYLGHRDFNAAQAAFASGVRCLGETASSLPMVKAEACDLDALDTALNRLNQVAPKVKRKIVEACSATVLADHRVTAREAELLRGILAILGCPLTPFDTAM